MARSSRSNLLGLGVLICLAERPMHPYEIAQTLKARGQDQAVGLNYGSLYAVVDSLSRRQLVSVLGTSRPGSRPARTVYEITEAGRLEATSWLVEVLSAPGAGGADSFAAGLSLVASLTSAQVSEALQIRLGVLRDRLGALSSLQHAARHRGAPRLSMLDVDYRAVAYEAEARFVEGVLADLSSAAPRSG